MTIDELQFVCHELAVEKGFWPEGEKRNVPEMLALIHAEVSEALECYRSGQMETFFRKGTGKPEGFGVELADTVIRILDLAGGLNIDLQKLIRIKLEYNKSRPYRHGKVC